MFTGLIEEIGKIQFLSASEIGIACSAIVPDSKIGDSIAINGVCLSIIKKLPAELIFNISPTTKRHTNFNSGNIQPGEKVNLERALQLTSRLGGHIVTGHVDGLARIIDIKDQNEFRIYELQVEKEHRALIASKGSIALDGISLTVASIGSSSFTVAIIPQTLKETTLGWKKIGQTMHFEVDILARYVHNILKFGDKDIRAASDINLGTYFRA